jgi:hypothetical protein
MGGECGTPGLVHGRRTTAKPGSSSHHRLAPQHEHFLAAQLDESDGPAGTVEEFHLERIRRMYFHYRTDLPGHQPGFGLVLKNRHNVQEFDWRFLHAGFIPRNT